MLILTANENLLERLVLLVQNSPPKNNNNNSVPKTRSVLLATDSAGGLPLRLPSTADSSAEDQNGDEAVAVAEAEEFDANSDCHSPSAGTTTANCCSPRQAPCMDWMVLMAKKGFGEHQITLQTLADLYRLAMTTSNPSSRKDSPMRILVLKKEHSEEDEQCFSDHQKEVRAEWNGEWGAQQNSKLSRFGESDAQREQLARSEHWSELSMPICALAYFDDPNLLDFIYAFFNLDNFQIEAQIDEEDEQQQHNRAENGRILFTKPPALHWTNYPRESEVQMTFKFIFPRGTVPNWVFREWTKMGKSAHCWDYEYEWTNGILLRAEELVKVTITRTCASPNVVEVSGRIDTDEAAEEEEEEREEAGEGRKEAQKSSCPLQRVWPYLVRVFQAMLADIEGRKTLPFSLNFVFIGEAFFTGPDGAPAVPARSLDAVQTLSSIQHVKCVRFRVDQQHIYSLNLAKCFPADFCPTKLADFCAARFALPPPKKTSVATTTSTSASNSEGASGGGAPSGAQTPILTVEDERHQMQLQQQRVPRTDRSRSPSCVPAIASAAEAGGKQPLSPSNSLHVERQLGAIKNRTRRVSFGMIHAIPSQDGAGGSVSPLARCSPSPGAQRPPPMGATPEPPAAEDEDGEAEGKGRRRKPVEEELVDELLKKAIDEVLVTD